MYLETISSEMALILNNFSNIPLIYTNFYLAGGTGLALHLGHRKSIDLDFFSEKKFNSEIITSTLTKINGKITFAEEDTVYAVMSGVKISFMLYNYPILKDFILFNQIKIADMEDIVCMKVIAISQRAEKKDFFDMFEILKIISPITIKELILKKYGENRINCYHILKSLFYFKDAEDSVEPMSLNNTRWKDVKDFFIKNEKTLREAMMYG